MSTRLLRIALTVAGLSLFSLGARAESPEMHAPALQLPMAPPADHAPTPAAHMGHATHWGYTGEGAPEFWGDLQAEYALCKGGKSQSPINIDTASTSSQPLPPIEVHYAAPPSTLVNNGHTIKVNIAKGSYIMVGGKRYDLLQFHFHTPSEHTINGRPAAMVAHFVHKAADGQLGVVGVLFEEGPENAALAALWSRLPSSEGEMVAAPEMNLAQLLPASMSYYNYAGSLTTPPCSEGVNWMVVKSPVSASHAQVAAFTQRFPKSVRPVQALNGRVVSTTR